MVGTLCALFGVVFAAAVISTRLKVDSGKLVSWSRVPEDVRRRYVKP